jgi:hypothetical protein
MSSSPERILTFVAVSSVIVGKTLADPKGKNAGVE